jgi:hypothetical protein
MYHKGNIASPFLLIITYDFLFQYPV